MITRSDVRHLWLDILEQWRNYFFIIFIKWSYFKKYQFATNCETAPSQSHCHMRKFSSLQTVTVWIIPGWVNVFSLPALLWSITLSRVSYVHHFHQYTLLTSEEMDSVKPRQVCGSCVCLCVGSGYKGWNEAHFSTKSAGSLCRM